MKLFAKLLAATSIVAAAQANALVIDFGATPWTPEANNQPTHQVHYELTGLVTASAGPDGRILFANDPEDGLGVGGSGRELDEIEDEEYLTLVFEKAINLVSIKLTDLFPRSNHADGQGSDGNDPVHGEVANIEFYLNGNVVGSTQLLGSASTATNGDQTYFATNGLVVDKIVFTAGGNYNEYSVKAIEVPEPGMFALLGLGLMGLGLSRRRQAKTA